MKESLFEFTSLSCLNYSRTKNSKDQHFFDLLRRDVGDFLFRYGHVCVQLIFTYKDRSKEVRNYFPLDLREFREDMNYQLFDSESSNAIFIDFNFYDFGAQRYFHLFDVRRGDNGFRIYSLFTKSFLS